MNDSLLKCPFCGGEALAHHWRQAPREHTAKVICARCGASTDYFENSRSIDAENNAVIAGNRRADGWRLASEEPTDDGDYLVCRKYFDDPESAPETVVEANWRHGCWYDISDGWTLRDVTHWMPLPEPPEGGDA